MVAWPRPMAPTREEIQGRKQPINFLISLCKQQQIRMHFEISLAESETCCVDFNICINCVQIGAARNEKPLGLFHKARFGRNLNTAFKTE